MCFVILSAVCYNDNTYNFLGFHKLYYCKCSCVYILKIYDPICCVVYTLCLFIHEY